MNHRQDVCDFIDEVQPIPADQIQIEVILLEVLPENLKIRNDETSPPRWIPRYGIRILDRRDHFATLSLTEKRAIILNLA